MAVTDNQPRVWQWVIADVQAAVENAFQLAEQLSSSSPAIQEVAVTLSNSPSGLQITGPLAQVRSEYESHGSAEFGSAQVAGTLDSAKVTSVDV